MKKLFLMLMVALLAMMPAFALAETAPEATVEANPVIGRADAALEGEGQDMAAINPWLSATEEEVAQTLGAVVTITPPEGFTLSDAAYLVNPDGTVADPAVARYAYTNAEEAMFRVHVSKDLSQLVIPEDAQDVNGTKVVYDEASSSISYLAGEFVVTIDAAGYTQEQLVAMVGSVNIAVDGATDEALVPAGDAGAEITEPEAAE